MVVIYLNVCFLDLFTCLYMGLGRIVRFITGTLGSRHLRQKTTPHVRIKTRSELTMYKKIKSWSKLTFKPDISYPISSRKPIGSRKTHISSKDVESGQFVMWQSKWMAALFPRFHHPPWNHCATLRKDEVNSGCFWICALRLMRGDDGNVVLECWSISSRSFFEELWPDSVSDTR